MKQRCLHLNHIHYADYGGRGIMIDPRWMRFENFLADMGERPAGKSLDRLYVNGPYTKKNCKWATCRQQARNRRPRNTPAPAVESMEEYATAA